MSVQESGPYLVRSARACDDCHGTGEHHPTTRGYMSHEVRDCETCGRSGFEFVSVMAVATLDEDGLRPVRDVLHHGLRLAGVSWPAVQAQFDALPVEGGKVELPHDTTITVEQVEAHRLAREADDPVLLKFALAHGGQPPASLVARCCAAWNARFAVAFNDSTRGEGR